MAIASKTSVVFHFISQLATSRASLPPDDGPENGRDQRHQQKNEPAHIAQAAVRQGKNECFGYFRRNPNELFAAEQPVDATGNEIERLLVLRQCPLQDELGVGND